MQVFLASISAFVLLAAAATAQDAPQEIDPGVTETGSAYRDAVRWRRLHHDPQYFDPAAPAPPPDLAARNRVADRAERNIEVSEDAFRPAGIIVSLLIVVGVALLMYRFGNAGGLGLRRPDNGVPRNDEGDGVGETSAGTIPRGLAEILSIRDRSAAIHALLSAALSCAGEQLDLYLHPSWTARDVLRRVPADWRGRAALGDLVRAAEEVHFGDRPISEDEFQRVARAVRPLFQRALP